MSDANISDEFGVFILEKNDDLGGGGGVEITRSLGGKCQMD